jgi:hypothetical protein
MTSSHSPMGIRQFSPLPTNCVVAVVAGVAGGSQIGRNRWRNRHLRQYSSEVLANRSQLLRPRRQVCNFGRDRSVHGLRYGRNSRKPPELRRLRRLRLKKGQRGRFAGSAALVGSKAMNKDMLDRLRSAVREGSQKSAESRPDKAAVQRWLNDHFTASPPGVCTHCGGGERAGDPFVIIPRRLLRVRRSPTNGREGCGLRGRPRRGLPDRVRRFAAGEPPMTRKRLHDSLRSGTRRPRGVRRAPNEIHCLPRQSSAD